MLDVIIIGGGLSGSLAAILLSRNGHNVTIIDRYETYPQEFRAEQLVGYQVGVLQRLGVLDELVARVPLVPHAISGRRGAIIGGVQTPHYGLPYASMVARLRSLIPGSVKFIVGRVISIEADGGNRRVILEGGTTLAAPLVILATGMNTALPDKLGIRRNVVRAGHSLALAFDIDAPRLGQDLVATYYGNTENRIDYLTVFPFEGRQRANLFMYTGPASRQANAIQTNPEQSLRSLMPRLEAVVGEFTVTGRPIKRLNDIWVSEPSLDGVVVIGDAFQTPCPSTGTGITRLATDADILCRKYIPKWANINITAAVIQEFYRDPEKKEIDRQALHDANYRRAVSTETSLRWQVHRKRVEVVNALRTKWTGLPPSIGMAGHSKHG